mmetsp:Transcript_35397/g.31871  ORF Transcript_35397/g.31871 Transcript_35397/m.31871 type:complete len:151 (+) Transcript_35397:336-788(+)
MATEWHQDGDIYQYPQNLFYTLLNAKIVPPVGGYTAFIDLRRAYQEADPSIRDKYEGAKYIFDTDNNPDFEDIKDPSRIPKITHDTIFTHPVRGEKSFYPCTQYGKVELRDGSTEPAKVLLNLITKDAPYYEHHYSVNDLIIFDDSQVLH